ncbi:hypothetical protein [Actimicrobium antarcticum]|uniref:Amidohydrolase-related domain-containing protein n=1 Tax=Actimicrobium antarcticum TaxID=1051899 RepID=A0ABP7SZB0_9BURK
MPKINTSAEQQRTKFVVFHSQQATLEKPLTPDQVQGKFEELKISPAAVDSSATSSSVNPPPKVAFQVHCDGHLHPTGYDQKGPSLLRMIQMANDINLKHFVAMKIPTNIMSLQWDKHYANPESGCGETYYLNESKYGNEKLTKEIILEAKKNVELFINTEVDWVQAREYMALTEDQKDRVDLAITGLHLGDPRAHFSFLQKIALNEAPFSLVGEVTLEKEIVMHLLPNESQADLKKHIKPFCKLIEFVGLAGLPMTIHCDVDTAIAEDVKKGHPKNLNGMIALLNDIQTEATTIIWAHFGGIGRFGEIPEGHYRKIDSLLHRFPQLMIDLSWSRVAAKLDPEEVAKVVMAHPDRFIMGSDALAPPGTDVLGHTYAVYNKPDGLFSKLDPETLDKILVKNYDKVIRQGRENGKKFKQHIMPIVEKMLADPAVDDINPVELRKAMLGEYKVKDTPYFMALSEEALQRATARRTARQYIEENSPLQSASSDSDEASTTVSTRTKLHRSLLTGSAPQLTEVHSSGRSSAMGGGKAVFSQPRISETGGSTPTSPLHIPRSCSPILTADRARLAEQSPFMETDARIQMSPMQVRRSLESDQAAAKEQAAGHTTVSESGRRVHARPIASQISSDSNLTAGGVSPSDRSSLARKTSKESMTEKKPPGPRRWRG